MELICKMKPFIYDKFNFQGAGVTVAQFFFPVTLTNGRFKNHGRGKLNFLLILF